MANEPTTNGVDLENYMTPKQVAEHYGVPIARVYTALQDGRLQGIKTDWTILVDRNTLPKKWPGRSPS